MIKKHPNMKQNPPASAVYSKEGYEFWSKKLWKKPFSMFLLELNKISTTLSKFTNATLQCYPY